MKRFLFTLGLLFFATMAKSQTISLPPQDSLEQWKNAFNVPALGIGIIEGAQLRAFKVIGELTPGTPAPTDALFDVASLTKPVTALLALSLVNQGKWDLHAPLYSYWVDPDVADDPRHKQLTTYHILAHQSGFKNWRRMHEDGKLAFDFAPGTKLQYSGEGYEYLKKALESKFKKSLDQLADSLIFEPLGMKQSYMVWEAGTDSAKLALAHNGQAEAYPYHKKSRASAADDLLTTVEDFAKFGIYIIKGAGLEDSLYRDMVHAHMEAKPGVGFGLGWVVFPKLSTGEYALLGAGSDQGVNAIVLLLPQSKRGLIAFTNGDQGRPLVMKMIMSCLEEGKEILGRF